MGLDMSLEKQSKLPTQEDGTSKRIEVGYWRKANAIHNWFVVNVASGEDDCSSYPVSQDQLECLRNLCHRLLIKKSENAAKRELQIMHGSISNNKNRCLILCSYCHIPAAMPQE